VAGRTWYFVVGGIAVAFVLLLIGLFEWNLAVPVPLQPKQKGILGAFLLGLIFGIVSSPCATPVLVLILTFVASKGEILYGTSLLFVYAIAHCALVFLAGVAAGFAEGFIRFKGISNVTTWGKRIGGSIVFLVGVYMVYSGVTL
jgi:cytochrome c-type biogenesis protein